MQRRQIWSWLHLLTGRLAIPLGIVNGGLGLKLAGASTGLKTAYAIVAPGYREVAPDAAADPEARGMMDHHDHHGHYGKQAQAGAPPRYE